MQDVQTDPQRSFRRGLLVACRGRRPVDRHLHGARREAARFAGPNYRADVRSVDIVGDAGVAVLVETDYLGCDFVDFFTVAQIDGRWWITNKTYAHTGGTPPAG
jgi:hypothetical protein